MIHAVRCGFRIAHRSRARLLSTRTAAVPEGTAAPPLCYDRDTGIVWEASPPSSPARRKRLRPLYQTVIGIEIHAQLSVPTKLFSSAPTRHRPSSNDATSNANASVHPYDLAYPGTLPSLSLAAVKASILSAAALNCRVHNLSRFERKHYFYPDLPHGYQITQQRWPLASDGLITFMPHHNRQAQPKKGKKKKKRSRGVKSGGNSETNENEPINDDQVEFEPRPVQLRIERVQMEQDTGKTTTHRVTNDEGNAISKSLIDYNRAGCALIEIVSLPDLRSAHEAAGAVEKIRTLMRHVGSCDGRMEEGSLRCDLNVSVAPIANGDGGVSGSREELPPGTGRRVEVKNLNSLRQVAAATEYEALRQSSLSLMGTPTSQETRTFRVKPTSDEHPLGGETVCTRAKGGAVDYRFMPEPDLPPLILDEETLGSNMTLEKFVEGHMPESPEEARARLVEDYVLAEDVADVITRDPPAIALFEQTVATARIELAKTAEDDRSEEMLDSLPTLAANWLCNDLFALIKKNALNGSGDDGKDQLCNLASAEHSAVDGEQLGALVAMVASGALSASMAKKVLVIMFENPHSLPKDIAEANGWRVISDIDALVELCKGVLLDPANASQLEQYRLGGKKVWKIEKYFAGKVMAASKGNAHPERMREALTGVLERLGS